MLKKKLRNKNHRLKTKQVIIFSLINPKTKLKFGLIIVMKMMKFNLLDRTSHQITLNIRKTLLVKVKETCLVIQNGKCITIIGHLTTTIIVVILIKITSIKVII